MTFSYSINVGGLNTKAYDGSYLVSTLGFSNAAINKLGNYTVSPDVGDFVQEYKALFGQDLAVTDGYKFFEDEQQDDPMDHLLDNFTSISYTSKTPVANRAAIYKQMFLNDFLTTQPSPSINVSANSINDSSSGYSFSYTVPVTKNGLPAVTTVTNTLSSAISEYKNNPTDEKTQLDLEGLYTQLEAQANSLKGELHTSTLAEGGYPSIDYTDPDTQVKLLQQQLDGAMQNFLTIYDQLFGYYKTKAGAHANDNDDGSGDNALREQEAASAATMTAQLAMNYAQQFYLQDIKPTPNDYVFGQAPLIYGTTATGATQNTELVNSLSDYLTQSGTNKTDATNQLSQIFETPDLSAGSTFTQYQVNNQLMAQVGIASPNIPSVTIGASSYNSIFHDMTQNFSLTAETAKPTDTSNRHDIGSQFSDDSATAQKYLNEIGGTEDSYIQWMVRDTFGVGGLTASVRNTDYCSASANTLSAEMVAAAQKLVDLKMKLETATITASINNEVTAEYESRLGAMQALQTIMCPNGTDPYTINIDGKNYVLGQDKDQSGTVNNMMEILGVNDSKDNTFDSLKALDSNNDGYVSQEELQANNIVLTGIDNNGQITDDGYDMSLVKGINLASLQKTDGTSNIFGQFTMDLQNKQVSGDVTFEDDSYFNKLFGWDSATSDDIDEDTSVAPIVIPPSPTTATPTPEASQSTGTVSNVPVATDSTPVTPVVTPATDSTSSNSSNEFSFNFTDADDNKSPIEKLFDQICWQLGINNITSTQRYNIIDSIDPTEDTDLAENEIRNDLDALNVSA